MGNPTHCLHNSIYLPQAAQAENQVTSDNVYMHIILFQTCHHLLSVFHEAPFV